jgi:hypothetical protein
MERELHDYTFCLQAAMQVPARYYLVFQDDAVPKEDFASVLELTLNKLNKCDGQPQAEMDTSSSSSLKSSSSDDLCQAERPPYTSDLLYQKLHRPISPSPPASWGFLKFYFPDRWNGFSFELLRLLDLISLLAVGGGLALFLHFVLCFVRRTTFEPSYRVFVMGVVLTLVTCQLLGRQNVNEVRRVSRYLYRLQPAPDCCTPAVLYPAPVLPFLVPWLAESPALSKVDLRISECFHHYGVPTFYLEPNLVRHVGLVTSLNKNYEKPAEELLFR